MALCLLFVGLFFGQAYAAAPTADVEVSAENTEARLEGAPFAISDFGRSNTWQPIRGVEGSPPGYRYLMANKDAFAVLVLSERAVLVYAPEGLKYPLTSATDKASFESLLEAIDAKRSNNGTKIADLSPRYEYTSESSIIREGIRYEFARELETGSFSVCLYNEDGTRPTNEPLFFDTGVLVPSESVVIQKAPEGLAAFWAFLTSIDLRPFWVSLKTSAVAMVFIFVLGLLFARVSMRINNRFKDVLDSILTIPMVLPPTVCGFLLLVAFGQSTSLGRWLIDHGIELVFSWPAAVIAAVVVSFPLMYRTARGAFESLDPALGDAARTLGWSERRIFFKLTMPLAWPSIAAGTVLAFARAMGEFGATLFVAGNYPGVTQTMPIAIYFEWMGGHSDVATFWVFVVILFSFVVILFVNMYAARTQRYRKTGADKDESRWGAEGKGAGKRKSAATDGAERGNEEVSP